MVGVLAPMVKGDAVHWSTLPEQSVLVVAKSTVLQFVTTPSNISPEVAPTGTTTTSVTDPLTALLPVEVSGETPV